MDDPPGRKAVAFGDAGLAGWAAAQKGVVCSIKYGMDIQADDLGHDKR